MKKKLKDTLISKHYKENHRYELVEYYLYTGFLAWIKIHDTRKYWVVYKKEHKSAANIWGDTVRWVEWNQKDRFIDDGQTEEEIKQHIDNMRV